MRFFFITIELIISTPEKIAMPIIIEGNASVFVDDCDFVHNKKREFIHNIHGSFYFYFLKTNNEPGCLKI